MRHLHLLELCGRAVRLAQRQCPLPLRPLHVADLLLMLAAVVLAAVVLAAVVLAAVALRHGIRAARGEQ